MTRTKICGFQRAEDVLAAAEAGVDAVGLVFVPSVRRTLTLDKAAAILAECREQWRNGPAPEGVGLFAYQPVEEVNKTVDRLGLDAVQLTGSEGMGYANQMTVPLYKVIAIDPSLPRSVVLPTLMVLLQRHTLAGHHPILDTYVSGAHGGTGQTFDWHLATDLSESFDFSLAGGLTPENVGEAISLAHPWGVNTSSGVETDGQQDPVRIRAFIEAVRRTDKASKPKGLRRLFSRSSS